MKVFSRILGIVVFAFAAYFLIGVLVPSIEYEIELVIDRPPDMVFEAFMDEDLPYKWVRGLESITQIKGDSVHVGAVYSVGINDGNKLRVFEETITELTPGSSLTYDLSSKDISGVVEVNCSSHDDGTLLHVVTKLTGNAWFMRSFLPLFKQSLKEESIGNYETLRSLIMVN